MNDQVARIFAWNSIDDSSKQSILFMFEIDSLNIHSRIIPFKRISEDRDLDTEPEVFLSMYSVYLIKSV
jgi:hypothetical protein